VLSLHRLFEGLFEAASTADWLPRRVAGGRVPNVSVIAFGSHDPNADWFNDTHRSPPGDRRSNMLTRG
jgi:hypothetical protein